MTLLRWKIKTIVLQFSKISKTLVLSDFKIAFNIQNDKRNTQKKHQYVG